MHNAHLRVATIKYVSVSKSHSTSVQVHCDRLAYEDGITHMLSVFGNDAEIAAIAAAVSSGLSLRAKFPDGTTADIYLGNKPVTFRGNITIPGRPRPLRHLLAFSETVKENGQNGELFVLHDRPDLLWASAISFLGLPAVPEWGAAGLAMLHERKLIRLIEGFHCHPVIVSVSREELLTWIGEQLQAGKLSLPEKNGPILWKQFTMGDLLATASEDDAEPIAQAAGF